MTGAEIELAHPGMVNVLRGVAQAQVREACGSSERIGRDVSTVLGGEPPLFRDFSGNIVDPRLVWVRWNWVFGRPVAIFHEVRVALDGPAVDLGLVRTRGPLYQLTVDGWAVTGIDPEAEQALLLLHGSEGAVRG